MEHQVHVLSSQDRKLLQPHQSGHHKKTHVSHEKIPGLTWQNYWLFNSDPYFMVYEIIHIKQSSFSSPTNPLSNQGLFHCSCRRQNAANACKRLIDRALRHPIGVQKTWKEKQPMNRVVDLALNQAAKPWCHQYLDPAWYHLWLCFRKNIGDLNMQPWWMEYTPED